MSPQETPVSQAEPSLFEGNLSIERKLDHARTELLDLSARNRLLHVPRSAKNSRIVEILDERSSEVFRLLVRDGRTFTFLTGKGAASDEDDDADEVVDLAQPEDESTDDRGVFTRHADTRLQTRLTSKGLQKRLLDLYLDAITLEQEQGVNILFLALGMLHWVDKKMPRPCAMHRFCWCPCSSNAAAPASASS